MTMRLGWPARVALLLVAVSISATWLRADPALEPKPPLHFNDNASVVDAGTASQLNEQLAQFERDSSSQIVVAIYPSLPDGADLDDYCIRTANSWVVDRKNGQLTGGSNSAVLFVFVNDHKMFIATGRDLEGALPDITCKQIIDNQIAPSFKQGDYAGGLRAGVAAMIAAAKGEYKGTGQTALERQQEQTDQGGQTVGAVIFIVLLVLFFLSRSFLPAMFGAPFIFSGGGYGSGYGGWSGGGGGGSSGFGGFSGGGGGGFGGGGAGGSW